MWNIYTIQKCCMDETTLHTLNLLASYRMKHYFCSVTLQYTVSVPVDIYYSKQKFNKFFKLMKDTSNSHCKRKKKEENHNHCFLDIQYNITVYCTGIKDFYSSYMYKHVSWTNHTWHYRLSCWKKLCIKSALNLWMWVYVYTHSMSKNTTSQSYIISQGPMFKGMICYGLCKSGFLCQHFLVHWWHAFNMSTCAYSICFW